MGKSKPAVIAVLYPGCIFFELALALELLATKYRIIFATPDGADHDASNGVVVRATDSYGKLDLKNCVAILIPGGDPGSIKDNVEIDEVIKTANSKGILLAAICAGPFILAKARVLIGKKIAHGYGPEQLQFLKTFFEGAVLTDFPVVSDQNIITARPEAHIDFAIEISIRLGVVQPESGDKVKNYYKGLPSTT